MRKPIRASCFRQAEPKTTSMGTIEDSSVFRHRRHNQTYQRQLISLGQPKSKDLRKILLAARLWCVSESMSDIVKKYIENHSIIQNNPFAMNTLGFFESTVLSSITGTCLKTNISIKRYVDDTTNSRLKQNAQATFTRIKGKHKAFTKCRSATNTITTLDRERSH